MDISWQCWGSAVLPACGQSRQGAACFPPHRHTCLALPFCQYCLSIYYFFLGLSIISQKAKNFGLRKGFSSNQKYHSIFFFFLEKPPKFSIEEKIEKKLFSHKAIFLWKKTSVKLSTGSSSQEAVNYLSCTSKIILPSSNLRRALAHTGSASPAA